MPTHQPQILAPEEFAALLEAARGGCGASLGQLLDAHGGYLHSIIAAGPGMAGGPRDSWLDLMQETNLRALQRFGTFRGATAPELRAWLRRILINLVADYWFERTRRPGQMPLDRRELVEDIRPIELAAKEDERDVQLRCAFLQLAGDQQEVLRLRDLEKWTWEAIGTHLEKSPDAARKFHVRALRALADFCKQLGWRTRPS